MVLDIEAILINPYVLMSFCIFTGILVGRITVFKRMKLGISGVLFIGLLVGWAVYEKFAAPFEELFAQDPNSAEIAKSAGEILKNGIVSKEMFNIFLILFVASVGLLAAKDIKQVMKKHSIKFVAIGLIVTFTGVLTCILMAALAPGQNSFAVTGVYTGALTSSPGLGAAIESVSKYGNEAQAMVGVGHAIGYPFGILIVILGVQFLPAIFKINKTNRQGNADLMPTDSGESKNGKNTVFDLAAFSITCIIGYLIGSVKINLGLLGYFSLGSSGGVLIAALVLGSFGKIGFLNFSMESRSLEAVRKISLSFFLAVVGLRYGHAMFGAFSSGGGYLILVSVFSGLAALMSGFLVGHYLFKIEWELLSGALCGGMTSTPGLGIVVESIGNDEPAAGYGATYPFALFCMVLFTIIMHTIPL